MATRCLDTIPNSAPVFPEAAVGSEAAKAHRHLTALARTTGRGQATYQCRHWFGTNTRPRVCFRASRWVDEAMESTVSPVGRTSVEDHATRAEGAASVVGGVRSFCLLSSWCRAQSRSVDPASPGTALRMRAEIHARARGRLVVIPRRRVENSSRDPGRSHPPHHLLLPAAMTEGPRSRIRW